MLKYTTISTIASAIGTLGVQIIALTILAPTDYGAFSVIYLAAAFGLSLQMSIVSEPWIRGPDHHDEWTGYSSSLLYLAIAAGALTAAVALFIPLIREMSWLAGIAAATAIYKSGSRFHSLRNLQWRFVLRSDIIEATLTLAAFPVVFIMPTDNLSSVFILWAAISLAAAVSSRLPALTRISTPRTWLRRHRKEIRPLLQDSIIMDVAAIGTPYALTPILGLAGFGIYRGVSNVAAPARLLLAPIRPMLSRWSRARIASKSFITVATAASLLIGALAIAALYIIDSLQVQLGTLSQLAPYAIPTGIFVASSTVGHFYMMAARQFSSHRQIMRGRAFQTVLAIALPILGGVFWGTGGAIWATAIATAIFSAAWVALVAIDEHSH